MKISLGKAFVWGLPSDRKISLSTSSPGPIEVDYDSLDEVDKKVIDDSLRLQTIVAGDVKVPHGEDEITRLGKLSFTDFRREIRIHAACGNLKLLKNLLESKQNTTEERVNVIKMALGMMSKRDNAALETLLEASIEETVEPISIKKPKVTGGKGKGKGKVKNNGENTQLTT